MGIISKEKMMGTVKDNVILKYIGVMTPYIILVIYLIVSLVKGSYTVDTKINKEVVNLQTCITDNKIKITTLETKLVTIEKLLDKIDGKIDDLGDLSK